MNQKIAWIALAALIALWACRREAPASESFSGQRPATQRPAPPALDLSQYEVVEMDGSPLRRVTLRDTNGRVLEQGYIDEKGLQTGEWMTFYPQIGLPYKLITYRAGIRDGLYIFFNEIGQVSLLATYKNNQLDGYWIKYRFQRPEEEAEYRNGKMHGTHRQYFVREGWLQFTTEYKDGVKDGLYRAYNKDGQVTLEYTFKDGKQVGGGIK